MATPSTRMWLRVRRQAGRAWHIATSVFHRIPRGARRALSWSAALLLALVAYGVLVEPRMIDERREIAYVPGLPPEWENATVALIADLQVGIWLANTDTVSRIVERLVRARPAAVLIAGDFVYQPTEASGEPREARDELEREDIRALREQMREVAALVRPLAEAGISTVAVLGNHDYAMRWPTSLPLPRVADAVAAALRGAGIVVLRNEARPLSARDVARPLDRRLHVVGLDAWFPRRTDIAAALRELPPGAPRVVLMHNPLAFDQLPRGSAPLALAAHTHGGQIRLPFLPHWSWMSLIKEAPVAADGWIPNERLGQGANRLYVNRGIGFSLAPIRINCPPELTWLTLRDLSRSAGILHAAHPAHRRADAR